MMIYSARLDIGNERDIPHEVVIEPLATEYLIPPHIIMTVIAVDNERQPYFYFDSSQKDEYTVVFLGDNCISFEIMAGRRFVCGFDVGESQGIEQDIEELLQAGHLGNWLKDEDDANSAK